MPVQYIGHSLTFTSERCLRESPRSPGHHGSLRLHHMSSTVESLVSSFYLVFIIGGRILIQRAVPGLLMLITLACFRQRGLMGSEEANTVKERLRQFEKLMLYQKLLL